MIAPWLALAADAALLALEVQQVVALRLLRLAAGGAPAFAESNLMLTEKAAALTAATATLAAGGTPGSVLEQLRAEVRANGERLAAAP